MTKSFHQDLGKAFVSVALGPRQKKPTALDSRVNRRGSRHRHGASGGAVAQLILAPRAALHPGVPLPELEAPAPSFRMERCFYREFLSERGAVQPGAGESARERDPSPLFTQGASSTPLNTLHRLRVELRGGVGCAATTTQGAGAPHRRLVVCKFRWLVS